MRILKVVNIKDSSPSVGIFEVIDDHLYYFDEPINYSKAVNGMVDAGNLFHRDIISFAYKNYKSDMIPDTVEFIESNLHNQNIHRYFPRGRVCYNVDEDTYYIYSCMEVLQNRKLVNEICRSFNLPYNKTELVADLFHYELLERS